MLAPTRGTKRFELTDHLGNVLSVILDRKTPVNTGSVLHKYDPDVQLVLDYYPYGMVMKEGYCDTCDPNAVTQTTGPALKMVNTDYTLLPQNYPPLTGSTVANWTVVTGGGDIEPQEEGQLSWEGTGGGMLFTCLNEVNPGNHELGLTALMEVTAEEAHEIEIVVDIDDAGELEAKIISYTDPEHTEYDVLTSTEIPTSTGYLLQFTPTTDTVWLWIGRKAEHGFAVNTKFKVTGTTTAKTTWTVYQMNIQGLLHSWRSPYRFAYNGQERVDDIKGKTNHNTALHWEYDTRRAWRWNRDPKPEFGISDYTVNSSNPILASDPLGDFDTRREAKAYKREHSIKGRIYKEKDGLYSINDTRNGVSYTKDLSLSGHPNVLGMQDDGVLKSATVTAEGNFNSNCYTCWMYDKKNSDDFKRAKVNGYMPFNPTVAGFSIPVTGVAGVGGVTSLNFVAASDGIGVGLTTGPAFGTPEASVGFSLFMAENISGPPTLENYMRGRGMSSTAGLGPFNVGFSQSYDPTGAPTFNTYSAGVSFSSRVIPSPFVASYNTSPVNYSVPLIKITRTRQ